MLGVFTKFKRDGDERMNERERERGSGVGGGRILRCFYILYIKMKEKMRKREM